MLSGLGDESLGQWQHWGYTPSGRPVVHLRRRLSETEALMLPHAGRLRDLRCTREGAERVAVVARETGHSVTALLAADATGTG